MLGVLAVGALFLAASLLAVFVVAWAVVADDRDERVGGLLLGVPAALLAVGSLWLLLKLVGVRLRRGSEQTRAAAVAGPERPSLGESVTLRPQRRKWTLILLTSAVLFVPCLLLTLVEVTVVGVAGSLLFGLRVLVSAAYLVPGAAYLRLAPEGLRSHAAQGTSLPLGRRRELPRVRGLRAHRR